MNIFIFSFMLFPLHASFASVEQKPVLECSTTREFVTALEFMRKDTDFKLKEPEAQKWAFEIAEGCTGAAKRFIRTSKTLLLAGANLKNSIDTSLKFAKGSDEETDAFVSIFRKAIAEDGLNLDFSSSLKIAMSLSKELPAEHDRAQKDFEKIVDFCSGTETLALSPTQCAPFAAAMVKKSMIWGESVHSAFRSLMEYLKSDKGPGLVTGDALKIAEELMSKGKLAPDNFKQAYQYAMTTDGLGLGRDEAIRFARKMAKIENSKLIQAESKSP